MTNPLGWNTHTEYNTGGNVVRIYDDLGTISSFTYTPKGLVETALNANNHTTRFGYNSDGFLTSKTDPAGYAWQYEVTELGWVTKETNPLSQSSTFEYDINGNVLKKTDTLNRTFTTSYDANGNVLSQSDGKGSFTLFDYNSVNQKVKTTDRSGNYWTTQYYNRGLVYRIYDPYGNCVENAYDGAGRLTKTTDPENNSTNTEYDANGNVITTIDKLGRKWTKQYDRLNRVVRSADPLGNITQTTFDAGGRVKTITSPKGWTSLHEYDGRGRLTTWKDPGGYSWRYQYDAVGNILKVTDALGGEYVMTYGPRNERLTERNQDGFSWEYKYDPLLRLSEQKDPNGTVRTFAYDEGGRIDYINYSTGRTDDYSYDRNNNPIILSRSGSGLPTTIQLDYDVMDRVTQYTDTFSNIVRYTYDKMSRRESITYPNEKKINYEYDKLSRLIRQVDWSGREMIFTYDKAARLLSRTYPNGIHQSQTYDGAGRLITIDYDKTTGTPPQSQVVLALSYAYDRNNNRITAQEQGTLRWTLPERIDHTMCYTASGCLIDRADTQNPINNTSYTYDDSGNMIHSQNSKEIYALIYDEQNRVMTLARGDGTTTRTITNRYDALGRRISRTLDGTETRYGLDLIGDMERILCEYEGSRLIACYIHAPGGLAYKVDSADKATCFHADCTGHILTLTDDIGTTLSQYAYTDYGRLLPGSSVDNNPYRYVGSLGVMEEFPNLYFMRARYYSAEAGIFLSTDPVKNIGPKWRSVAYLYGNSNPYSMIDPTGLFNMSAYFKQKNRESTREYYRRQGVAKKDLNKAPQNLMIKYPQLRGVKWLKPKTYEVKQKVFPLASNSNSVSQSISIMLPTGKEWSEGSVGVPTELLALEEYLLDQEIYSFWHTKGFGEGLKSCEGIGTGDSHWGPVHQYSGDPSYTLSGGGTNYDTAKLGYATGYNEGCEKSTKEEDWRNAVPIYDTILVDPPGFSPGKGTAITKFVIIGYKLPGNITVSEDYFQ